MTFGRWLFLLAAACVALAALAADPDPEADRQAVNTVCGRCHSTKIFLGKPRSWDRWNDTFADMVQRGAKGTDEELERVTRYFLENLTIVNVNTSEAEELAGVLGVSEEVAKAIIAQREKHPFDSAAQLRAFPGVNADTLEQRKDRILFER